MDKNIVYSPTIIRLDTSSVMILVNHDQSCVGHVLLKYDYLLVFLVFHNSDPEDL